MTTDGHPTAATSDNSARAKPALPAGSSIPILDQEIPSFDREVAPALEIEPGGIVAFRTSGEVLRKVASGIPAEQLDLEGANLVTGPVLVRGAEPGDALRIEVLDIAIHEAWAIWIEGLGPLGHLTDGIHGYETPIIDGTVRISEELAVPLAPMIGCIGVAPADAPASTVRPVYPTGGNLDLRDLSPGATLWLPVAVSGGLLSLGDIHAAMGHGEPTFVAIEAAGTATVRIDVEKGSDLRLPRLRTGRSTVCVGMGQDYPQARTSAVQQAFDLLTGTHGLSAREAYGYASGCVELRPAGPAGSMVEGLEAALAVVPDP